MNDMSLLKENNDKDAHNVKGERENDGLGEVVRPASLKHLTGKFMGEVTSEENVAGNGEKKKK